MGREIKVSVVVPVYNSEKTLTDCLQSLIIQSYGNFEIIVVDNNSNDKSKELIKSFEKKDEKIRYIFEPEIGRGKARNTGENNVAGKVILMTDSDCIVPHNWISEMIKPILNGKCDAVQGFEEGASSNYWSRQQEVRILEQWEKYNLGEKVKIDTKNFAIRYDTLKKLGFTNRKYASGNDSELMLRFYNKNLSVVLLKDIKVKHHHPSSFYQVVKKQFNRARWRMRIGMDNKELLNKSFKEGNVQTFKTFFIFFPAIIFCFFKRGVRYSFFELISGMAWRAGILFS